MSTLDRIMASALSGMIGWAIGRGLDLPVWTQWEVGDRADLAVCAALLVWIITRPTQEP